MSKISFPKIGEKHKLTPLFDPGYIGDEVRSKIAKIPKRAVFIYSKTLEKTFVKNYKFKRYPQMDRIINPDKIYVTPSRNIILKLSIGAPLTAVVAEELISVGVKEFLILGTAGSLDEKLKPGDLVLCNKAVRDEGTSHHYLKNSMYVEPDHKLTDLIGRMLLKNKIKYKMGSTWSIDAPYVETREEVSHYKRLGIATVEMEASALFAVAKRRKVKAAALFIISDILSENGWSGFVSTYKNNYPNLAKIAMLFDKEGA